MKPVLIMSVTSADKVLVLGLNPSNLPTLEKHRKNYTHDRLNKWLNFLNIDRVSFSNVINTSGEYRVSDVDFKYVDELCEGYEVILALGGFVSNVLNRIAIPHFTLPHPSPKNRLLNSRDFELKKLIECREYINEKSISHR